MSNRDLILVPFLLLLLNYVHGEETSLGLSSIEHERKFPLFIPTLKPIGAPSQPINGNDWRRRPFSNLPLWKNGLAAVGKHIFSDKYKNFLPSLSNPDTEDMLLEPCPARCTPFRLPLRILLRFVGIVIPDTGIEGLRGLARLVMELLSRVVRILGFMRDGKPTIVIIKEIAPIFNIFGVPTKLTELLVWLGWKNDDHGINPLPLPWTPNIMEIIRNIIFGQFPSWKNMLTMILQWLKWIQSMTGSNRWIQWIIQIIITITGGGQICWILQPITWILQVFRTLSMGLFESFDVTLNVLNNSLRRIIQIFLPGLGPGFDIVAILPRIVRVLFGNPTGYLKIFTQSWLRFFGFNKPEQIIVLIRKTLPWVPTQLLYAIAPMISGIFPSATAKPNVPWIRPDWDTREGIWYPPTFPSPVLRKLDLPSSDFESGPAAEIDPLEEMQAIETGPAAAIETDKAVDETGPAAELEAVRAFDELGPAAALKTDERFGALGPAAALETEEGFGELGPAAALETEEGFGESGPAAASETGEATAIDESGPASIPFRVFKPNYDIPLPPSPYYNYYYPWFTKQGQGNPWLRNPWLRNRGSGYSSKKKNKDEKCNESVDGASTKPVLDLNTPTVTKN
ncbi:hypothetical protein RN001_011144 [Aquatica leii]|uniref:Uncharacterized protein n=1 Tax=Aquatica leii TaxID=1421715 RepID=A0AAN7SNM2_9COLE|nr:hypothetical protein RN001_011144 [Aquatica leii]